MGKASSSLHGSDRNANPDSSVFQVLGKSLPGTRTSMADHNSHPDFSGTALSTLGIGAVPHGFRSSFRDWAAECSDAPREVCELALAHVNSDRVEAAYRRTDLFERRRELMEEWAGF